MSDRPNFAWVCAQCGYGELTFGINKCKECGFIDHTTKNNWYHQRREEENDGMNWDLDDD
jgi:hypothetical protein